ncbi:hypothetical protein QL285_024959 [Trifolium repens]|jgi:hypothetical protein|nr:hypothetical protein QL285_024959 [Trifolium repens]
MKYCPCPQSSFGGTFTSILIPTGKNSPTSDLQTGQSLRESPFTDEIDIPNHIHIYCEVNSCANALENVKYDHELVLIIYEHCPSIIVDNLM